MRPQPLLLAALFIYFPAPSGDPLSMVKGTITDPLGSGIAGATVRFFEGPRESEVQTAPDGTYSIRLAPGLYTASAKSLGFCMMRRSRFILEKNTQAQLDFELVLCAFDSFKRPYEEEELPSIDASGLKPLVQFGCRKEHGAIEYTGHVEQGVYVRPVFTYDLWTLRANSIVYDPTIETLTAEGNVAWQDGQTTTTGRYIRILLHRPLEVVKMTF